MEERKGKGIPLGARWDMQEATLLDGALPKATRPNKSLKPKSIQAPHAAKNAISDKTNDLLAKLKGKR